MKKTPDYYRRQLSKLIVKRDTEQAKLLDLQAELKTAKRMSKALRKVQTIVQDIAKELQQSAHEQIASVVTLALRAVFDDPYEFRILFDKKRGRTEARPVFVRNDKIIDPTLAAGGGPVDVAAFALRLICLALAKPKARRLLILDEPFRFVSPDYRPNIRNMLESLSDQLDVQIVMTTHMPEITTGDIMEMQKCGTSTSKA